MPAKDAAMAEKLPELIQETAVQERDQTAEPPMYRVLLYNDDYTTKEFVVVVLVDIFHKPVAEATQLMWRIHRKGKGVAGIFPREIAETKAATTREMAREQGFPLQLSLEPDDPA